MQVKTTEKNTCGYAGATAEMKRLLLAITYQAENQTVAAA